MNPQDYPPQPNPNQPSSTTSSTEAWFNSLPSPEAPPTGPAPQKSSPKKLLIVSIAVIATLVFVAVISFLLFRPKSCLTATHYRDLTGITLEEQLSPTDNFYTRTYDFAPGTDRYAAEAKAASEKSFAKIGEFYRTHTGDTSIIITITSDFLSGTDDKASASQRIAKLKGSLNQAGVPDSAIHTVEPTAFTADGELSGDSEELKTAKAYLSITSDAACRQ